MCIDPNEIQKSITAKTTAILPVHFGGFPCNLKDIQDIAEKHNLTLFFAARLLHITNGLNGL